MPKRGRLLDMGQVTPLRAYSLRLALAEALGPDDPPALLMACAASPVVALGEDSESSGDVDLEACEAGRVPVLRLPGRAPARWIAEGDLLLSLILPMGRAAELDLPAANEDCHGWLSRLLAAAGGSELGGGSIGVDTVAGSLVLSACLGFDLDPGDAEGESLRSPAELGESFLQLLERRAGLELVPSMPLPEELDAVYEWDRRLVAAADRVAVPALARPVA